MMKMKRRRRGPLPFRYVFLLSFVFFLFSTAFGVWLINEGIKPTLVSYAKTQTNKIATLVISKAINKNVNSDINQAELFEVVETSDGSTINFNTELINRMAAQTTNLVQLNLAAAERGEIKSLEHLSDVEIDTEETVNADGIVYSVPLGQATNNALLGNLGPKVPIRFNAIGDVQSNAVGMIEPFGINNAFVKIFIHIEVNVQIIIPFATETTTVQQEIPVAMTVIKGSVPQFYNGGGESDASFEIPLQ
ncbi:sporulation protein [Bacillus coahuilensis p1.1.43]|uniref:Sporulation protein n=1 Tax=Bacillus coahuilensis p1.1.43 TaxID=1150625 RepID=A0A147K624_9BACI|nr:sporulation protein YunB [Bacillus coahuilensis]KUP05277.1 sporulation protein [Bacillus coahuilensis p1.1.43]